MTGEIHSAAVAKRARPRWGVIAAWIGVIGLMALLGFGLLRAQQGPIGIGTQVPDFDLRTFTGETLRAADLRGRVVVINFWASWCETCEDEAAFLEQAYQEYRDRGVVFLGVDYVDTEPEALHYLDRFGITYPNGPDLGTRISQAFRIRGVPETYVVAPDGALVAVSIGPYESLAALEAHIDRAFRVEE